MSDEISIQFTRFSAFYSPLIATLAGGFLKGEGFQPRHSVAAHRRSRAQRHGARVPVGALAATGTKT